jgi:iron complex outermembrane receptor protein
MFAELVMPLAKGLELTGGVRYDSISGVKDKLIGKTFGDTQHATTYKLSGKYQFSPTALLRGSYGTGFRTATMQQVAEPKVDFGVTGGTFNCPFNANYDPLGYLAKGYLCPDKTQYEVFHSGNADLKPEKSTQWTVGVVFEPASNLSVGLDLWSVEVKNAVQRPSERLILSNPAAYLNLFAPKFKASNGLTYVAINQFPINIGQVQNQGLDWDFTLKQKTDFGRVTGRIGGTYLIRSRYTTPGTSDQWETSLGQFGSNDAVSFRNVIRASASLDTGKWNHTLTMNYRSGYKDIHHDAENCAVDDGNDCIDTQLIVPEYITMDWQTKWSMNKSLDLTLGITNIGDVKPPLSLRNTGSHQLGYDPRYASALGRTFYLQASYRF